MRVLLITQWFDPEPTFKGLAFARELTKLGHQVQVLTGFPNYPGGAVYPGYRIRVLQRERIDAIDVVRVPLYPSHSRSALGRIANYLSFALAAATIGAVAIRRADVIYAYHPPATVGLPALVIRALHRSRLVYDIQDLWPDTLAATGMMSTTWALKVLSAFCRFIYRSVDHITVLSPGFKRVLSERGVSEHKVSVIYNWCDEDQLAIRGKSLASPALDQWRDKFLVVFAGTMGVGQAIDSVLEAARIVAHRSEDVHFLFVGGGTETTRLSKKAVESRLSNVSFLPPVPLSEIGHYLDRADVLLVHLRDDPLFEITIPSKTQAYMASGRPILMAVAGDAASLVIRANCGIACRPERPAELAEAVCALKSLSVTERSEMGRRGRHFYETELSLASGTRQFDALFRRLAGTEEGIATQRVSF